MTDKTRKPLALAIGTAFVATLAASTVANAASTGGNPFTMTEMSSGYMQLAEMKDGKCGEGKCGGSMNKSREMKDGKCGGMKGSKGMKDGKCGEGKCGGSMGKSGMKGQNMQGQNMKGMKDGKCGGSGNMGMSKQEMQKKGVKDGKCGEGKCGGSK